MKNRYLIVRHDNLDIAFFSTNMEKHAAYISSCSQADLDELFTYCHKHYVTAFAMSRERGHIEELRQMDSLIGRYHIRMTSTQLSFLGSVLSIR